MEMEEYLNWKKNAPVLYDLVVSHPLEWPSLTVQWLPWGLGLARSHRLVLGTHASDDSPEPTSCSSTPCSRSRRAWPRRPPPRAAPSGPVRVPSAARRRIQGEDGDKGGADAVLRGHGAEGYGLAWSAMKEGFLLSGSYDKKICLWDLKAGNGAPVLDAQQVFEMRHKSVWVFIFGYDNLHNHEYAHEDVVEDVAWHLKDENLFGSVGDDCKFMMWDLRTNKPEQSMVAHQKEVNSLSFNPFNEWILATASGDGTIKLFDLRKLSRSLHAFDNHEGEVFQVEWNPNLETVLASHAADKRVMIWDVSRIGEEQADEDAGDGPPELLFVHGGHTAKISELSWNPSEKWVVASVAEDNVLQIWEVAESIYSDDNGSNSNAQPLP
uniref:Histone-binding protein RBBP4-like N-terminal domain-containing protein n=1 Tax=Aegilops tauschii TaxID=37682 RepID=M8BRA7_AEGTA